MSWQAARVVAAGAWRHAIGARGNGVTLHSFFAGWNGLCGLLLVCALAHKDAGEGMVVADLARRGGVV